MFNQRNEFYQCTLFTQRTIKTHTEANSLVRQKTY